MRLGCDSALEALVGPPSPAWAGPSCNGIPPLVGEVQACPFRAGASRPGSRSYWGCWPAPPGGCLQPGGLEGAFRSLSRARTRRSISSRIGRIAAAMPGRVGEVPVEVPLAGEDRAGITAAHGDHHIGDAGASAVSDLGNALDTSTPRLFGRLLTRDAAHRQLGGGSCGAREGHTRQVQR